VDDLVHGAAQPEAAADQPQAAPEQRRAPAARRKAAIMALALGPQLSAEVFRHLTPEEIDELVLEIAALESVPNDEKQAVLEEFWAVARAQDFATQGGIGYAKDVLERALGDQKAYEVMSRLSSYVRLAPFEFLRKVEPQQIFNFLQNEHPQTIALVLAYLPAESAATVMAMLPGELQAEVSMRVAVMDRTAPEVVREVEQVMERKLSLVINQELATAGGVRSLVDILNHVDRSTERNIIDSLDEHDGELADHVRKLMFVFEDLLLLDDRSIQHVLKDVEMKDVALALRGANEDVCERIFRNMSQRASQMLREDMEFMGPVRRRMIEDAQARIVAAVRRLEEAGRVTIHRGGTSLEDELVA
jgi:flagellar motor switch protein FliG